MEALFKLYDKFIWIWIAVEPKGKTIGGRIMEFMALLFEFVFLCWLYLFNQTFPLYHGFIVIINMISVEPQIISMSSKNYAF